MTKGGSSRGSRLRRAAGASLVSRGIGIASSLVLTPIVIAGAGQDAYGVFATITSLAGVAIVTDLGIGAGLVARLAQALGKDDLDDAARLTSSGAAALTGLGALLMLVVCTAAALLPTTRLLGAESLPAGDVTAALIVFAVALGLGLPAGLGDRVLIATQRGATAALWSLVVSSATLAATAVAAHTTHSLPVIVAGGALTPRVMGALQTYVVFSRTCPELRPRRTRITRDALLRLRSAGLLFLVQGLAISVAYESDLLVVSSIRGAGDAGVYSVTLRVTTLVASAAVLALGQLFPAFGEALARGELAWVRRAFRRLVLMLVAYDVVMTVGLLTLTPWFVSWWAGPEFVPPRSLLLGLVLWNAYSTLLIPASMLMNAALVIKPQAVVALTMAAVNLPLSIVLTHRLGVAGPAWGSLTAHVIVSLIPTVVITRRLLRDGAGNIAGDPEMATGSVAQPSAPSTSVCTPSTVHHTREEN